MICFSQFYRQFLIHTHRNFHLKILILIMLASLLLLFPVNSFCSVNDFEITDLNFRRFPLAVKLDAEPGFKTSNIVTDEDLTFSLQVFKDDAAWWKFWGKDTPIFSKNSLFTAQNNDSFYSLSTIWCPPAMGTYYVKLEVYDSGGSLIESATSKKYQISETSFVRYKIKDHIIKSLSLPDDISDEDFIERLRNEYDNEHNKFLFYLTADVSPSFIAGSFMGGVAAGWIAALSPAANLGLGFYLDVMDYFGVTEEGGNGWVSIWLDFRTFYGWSLPAAVAGGVIPVSIENISSADSRPFLKLLDTSGNLNLGIVREQYDTAAGGAQHAVIENYSSDIGFGQRLTSEVKLEFTRGQIDRVLACSIFEDDNAFENILDDITALSVTTGDYSSAAASALTKQVLKSPQAALFELTREIKRVVHSENGFRAFTLTDKSSDSVTGMLMAESLECVPVEVEMLSTGNQKLSLRARAKAGSRSYKEIYDDIYFKSVPEGALTYESGYLRWVDTDTGTGVDKEAVAIFTYRGAGTAVKVTRKDNPPPPPVEDPDQLNILSVHAPDSITGNTSSRVSAVVEVDNYTIDDASVQYELWSRGEKIITGNLYESGGVYQNQVQWPNVSLSGNLKVIATRSGDLSDISYNSISIKKTVEDTGPRTWKDRPTSYPSVNVRSNYKFIVESYTYHDELERVRWYLTKGEGQPREFVAESHFGSNESKRGKEGESITFDTVGENQLLEAVTLRKDGRSATVHWYVDVKPSDAPVLTIIDPPLPDDGGQLILPLGQQTYFRVSLFDQDDDTRHVFWFLNGEQIEDDKTGGGNPSQEEYVKVNLTEVGDYTLLARATDNKGNSSEVDWLIHAGTTTPGNSQPDADIEYPDGLEEGGVLRVGYRYDFDFVGYDIDSNLAYGEVWLNGEQNWSAGCNQTCYYDDRMHGDRDKASISDVIFNQSGENTLLFLVRDTDGAEVIVEKIFDVKEADQGSSVAPSFGRLMPAAGSPFYLPENGEIEFHITAVDPDGDLEKVRLYKNNAMVDDWNLRDDTCAYLSPSIKFPNSGTYSIFLELLDRAGNICRSDSYTVHVGSSAGSRNHSPVIIDAKPAIGGGPYRVKTDVSSGLRKFRPEIAHFDLDGDATKIYWMSSAGQLDDVDGTLSDGREYDRSSFRSSEQLFGYKNNGFYIEYNGTISCFLEDSNGNRSPEYVWQVLAAEPNGNTPPQITWSSIQGGDKYNVKYGGSNVCMGFQVFDADGDLSHCEFWADGILQQVESFNSYMGYNTHRYDRSDCRDLNFDDGDFLPHDGWSNERTGTVPAKFIVYDDNDNTTTIDFTVSYGLYNHPMEFTGEAINVSMPEDTSIMLQPDLYDEDNDRPYCAVSGGLLHGVIKENPETRILTYIPEADFNGEDQVELICTDRFGSIGVVTYNITITPQNDPPLLQKSEDGTTDYMIEYVQAPLRRNVPFLTLLDKYDYLDIEDKLNIDNANVQIVGLPEGVVAHISRSLASPFRQDSRKSEVSGECRDLSFSTVTQIDEDRAVQILFSDSQGAQSDPFSLVFRAHNLGKLLFQPCPCDFGNQAVASNSLTTVTVKNIGLDTIEMGDISLEGDNAQEFAIEHDNCSSQILEPQETATIEISFSPTGEGSKISSLVIPTNDTEHPIYILGINGCVGACTSDEPNNYFFRDNDGDGFGDQNNSVQACSSPTGYVNDNTDCNDNDADEHPGQTWYRDQDSDGYPDDWTDTTSCSRLAGYLTATELTSTMVDNYDNDNTVYPGAPEICDGKDNDQDGEIDEGCDGVVNHWLGNYGCNWHESSNWNLLHVPDSSESVSISNLGGFVSNMPQVYQNHNAKSISIGDGGSLILESGCLTLSGL